MKAFTLLEITVAAGLSVVVFTLLALLLYATSVSTVRGQARVDIQQQAILASNRMVTELMQCTPAGVGVLYTPDVDSEVVLSLHKVVDVSSTVPPSQVFARQLTVFWWLPGEGSLWQRTVSDEHSPTLGELGLTPLNTARPTRGGRQETLLRMVRNTQDGKRSLAQGVVGFQIVSGGNLQDPLPSGPPQSFVGGNLPPSLANPVTLALTLEKEVRGGLHTSAAGNPCERFQVQRTIWLRDGE